jgi:putative membrane-bound dehydrogenase-like protein
MLRAFVLLFALPCAVFAESVETPRVLDDRLTLQLIAAEPQIVTPTGIAVDAQGRVLVVECHTHFRPENYQGPPTDRIRRFSDANGDGTFEKVETVLDGTRYTMSVAIDHSGQLYGATRSELFRIDEPPTGGPAKRATLVRLETKGDYPHNGLSGFAFDLAGRMYFGMGENLGVPFELVGSDGSKLAGEEGGHIFRCRLDGSQLERFATGFWNPFHVAFDAYGRLFAVDNDPDSLPPCRLMHIVEGGDYGYKFRNGRKGLHPFTAWNGELPGTLPMVAGTGEAPSGVVAYESWQFPEDYRGVLLTTSWGDHRIESFKLQPRGASLKSVAKPVVQGGEDFRPVGIAVAPDGSIFFSDWVDKSYPVHGKGRIWRLSAKNAGLSPAHPKNAIEALESEHGPDRTSAAVRLAATTEGRASLLKFALASTNERARAAALRALASGDTKADADLVKSQPSDLLKSLAIDCVATDELGQFVGDAFAPEVQAAVLRRTSDRAAAQKVWLLTESADPVVQQAARLALAKMFPSSGDLVGAARNPAQRMAALLILRGRNDDASRRLLSEFAGDSDPAIRFVVIQWIGEERLDAFRDLLETAIKTRPTTPRLFAGYLAALERLDRGRRDANDEWSGEQYLLATLLNRQSSTLLKSFALRSIRPDHGELTGDRFRTWLASDDSQLALEAIRTLRNSPIPNRSELLLSLAGSEKLNELLRAEAVVGLSAADAQQRGSLLVLATNGPAPVRHEALRALRGASIDPQLAGLRSANSGDRYAEELLERLASKDLPTSRPAKTEIDSWLALLKQRTGDAQAGERVFFHPQGPGCFRCHTIDGRGGNVGPDLSRITYGADRRRLLESLLQPSREVAPQFTSWQVRTTSGTVIVGILLGEDAAGNQSYGASDGTITSVQATEIEERVASRQSIMPENIVEQMTLGEIADLLALMGGNSE